MKAAFKKAKKQHATIVYNPAPAIQVPTDLFNLADYIIVNESEHSFYKSQLQTGNHVIIQTLGQNGVKNH